MSFNGDLGRIGNTQHIEGVRNLSGMEICWNEGVLPGHLYIWKFRENWVRLGGWKPLLLRAKALGFWWADWPRLGVWEIGFVWYFFIFWKPHFPCFWRNFAVFANLKLGSFWWLTATFMPRGGYGSAQGRLAATRDLYKFGSFCFHIKNQTSKIKIAESPAAMSFLFRTELSKSCLVRKAKIKN